MFYRIRLADGPICLNYSAAEAEVKKRLAQWTSFHLAPTVFVRVVDDGNERGFLIVFLEWNVGFVSLWMGFFALSVHRRLTALRELRAMFSSPHVVHSASNLSVKLSSSSESGTMGHPSSFPSRASVAPPLCTLTSCYLPSTLVNYAAQPAQLSAWSPNDLVNPSMSDRLTSTLAHRRWCWEVGTWVCMLAGNFL
jgi:hypothetical protein